MPEYSSPRRHRLRALVVSVAVLCLTALLQTPAGAAAPVLLSQGRPATASSSESGAFPASAAVDGDSGTRWSSAFSDPQWIQVDLGSVSTLDHVALSWEAAYAKAFTIQSSTDGSTWTTRYSTTAGAGGNQTITVSGSGRYVRVYGTQRATQYGYSLWTFDVYGTVGSPSGPGKLVWSDEFTGAAGAPPDPAKWGAETGTGQNNELQYYTPNRNSALDGNGDLVITARREATAGSSCPRDPVSGSTTCQYTSGRITTQNKFTVTYGHIEARIKVSGTDGLWPAFWLLGSNISTTPWPGCGEIDVMEHLGKQPDLIYSTIHGPGYSGAGGIGQAKDIGTDFAAGFHVFGVDWDSTHFTFSVDGTAFETINRSTVESTRGPWVFDHPFFIILNNAVGGDFPGPPDASTVLPQNMVIDYVRVYQ